jgi:hypothetical protein
MINEAIGFKEWLRLNEAGDPAIEVYTEFSKVQSRSSDLLVALNAQWPAVTKIIEKITDSLLEREFKKHFAGIDFQANGRMYTIVNSQFEKEEEGGLVLNFNDNTIVSQLTRNVRKMSLIQLLDKNSKKNVVSSSERLEFILNDELNTVPEKDILSSVLELAKNEWLSDIDPSSFRSDLESILISYSLGDSFFDPNELTNLISSFLTVVAFEIYSNALSESIEAKRIVVNLANLESELGDTLASIKSVIRTGANSREEAKQILDFIRYLTFKLRPKEGRVKERADSVLAETLTEIEKAGITKKIMDVL